ncbi:MAG: M20 family metallopeptidase [Limnochordaceae bacterium]|nr:M20 family metallopeptidase [Limnochordaceae bacterium]
MAARASRARQRGAPGSCAPHGAPGARGFHRGAGVAGLATAFRAAFRGGAGPTVAFLAEYDALPELGHACGHNLIAASCVGAALVLRDLGPALPGTVVVMGCPAEETSGGKIPLLEAGAFAGVDVAMSVHPGGRNSIGGSSLASHPVELEFFGKASHAAAAPEQGINALQALVLALQAIWALRSQLRDDVRLPGIILDGGKAPNVVPDYARARLSVRAADAAYLEQVVVPRIRAAAEGAALATGASVRVRHYEPLYEELWQNDALSQVFRRHLESLGRSVQQLAPSERAGSTDVGNVSHAIPTIHPTIAVASPDVPAHTREFAEACRTEAGEQGMLDAARAMALTALEWMQDAELREQVRLEHERRRQSSGGTPR